MTLFGWELIKILKRRMTRVILAVSLVLAAGSALFLGFSNYSFGVEVAAPTWQARSRSVQATADAAAWHGPLTAETLCAARDRCRTVLQQPAGDLDGADAYVAGDILYMAARVFTEAGEISWANWPAQSTALDDDALAQLYTLRARHVAAMIDAAPADRQAALRVLNDRVSIPFVYDWVDGHEAEIVQLGNVIFLVGLLLCAAVAPVFCGEVHTRVYTVSHCARHGRGRLAAAKLAAALVFAGGAFAVCTGVFVAVQLALFGARGLSASLQITAPDCVLPLSYGQAEAWLLLGGLVSCLAGVAITAALSARLDSEFPVLLVLFALLVFLRALVGAGMLGGPLEPLSQSLPFLSGLQEFLDNRLLALPAPWYRLAVQPLYLVVLLPLAWRWYVRRQVR